VWKTFHHPNVLPLLGATMSNNQFAMVSEWMVNGNVNEYVTKHRNTNRFELVGLGLTVALPLADCNLTPTARRRR
jgi:hypothetical protein